MNTKADSKKSTKKEKEKNLKESHPSRQVKIVMTLCVVIVLAVAIWYFVEAPRLLEEKAQKFSAKYDAEKCDMNKKLCLFKDSNGRLVVCKFIVFNNDYYFGNCYLRGEIVG